ncbi:MAG: hypothetical protein ACK506_18980 [Pirellula sp.]|jgi:hypothetical protein
MAVFLQLEFDAYYIPPIAGNSEFSERIAANNAEVEILKKLWKDFQHYQDQALPLLRQNGLKGITYYSMQEMLAAAIDTAIEIIERERVLFDPIIRLLEELAANRQMPHETAYAKRSAIYGQHNRCSEFTSRIKRHLQTTLLINLQTG